MEVCVNCLPSDLAHQSRNSPGLNRARQQSFVFERDIYMQPEMIYQQKSIGPAYLVLIALALKDTEMVQEEVNGFVLG